MIKNIVFDIGNVLVTFQPVKHFNTYFKDEDKTKRLCHEVFAHEAWGKYDQGIYFMDDLKRIYKKTYPSDYEDIEYMLEHWLPLLSFLPDSYAYFQALKKRGFRIYLLSNISKDSADYLKNTMPFFQDVHGSVLSYEVNINKPDKRIYEHLLQTYQLRGDETIFLDDSEANIEEARHCGIYSVLFEQLEDVKQMVEEHIRSQSTC